MRLDEADRKIQVEPEHYAANTGVEAYDSRERWCSYWQQINVLLRLQTPRIVEIGSGNGILKWYLESQAGLSVRTVDIDPSRNPDVVCDISKLRNHFPKSSQDAVVAFQVLEHLPFREFDSLLSEMAFISRRYVIISLPVWGRDFRFTCGLGKYGIEFSTRVRKLKNFEPNDQHYWEINAKGSSLKTVREKLSHIGTVVEDYLCPGNSYHRFFVVEIPREGFR